MRISTRNNMIVVSLAVILSLLVAGCASGSSQEAASRDSGHEVSSRSTSRTASSRVSSRTASTEHGAAPAASAGHGAASPGTSKEVHWAYDGDLGPSHWGDLADAFATCKFGTSQSPIDIAASVNAQPVNIEFNYHSTPLRILNNGHTLQVNYAPGSSITIDHQQYELLQFHFHTPSEHQVSSHSFAMEGHLVHKSSSGELAVVGVFIEEGQANPFFQTLVEHLPNQANEEQVVPGIMINSQDMLPHDQDIYNYSGSLTTPPCSEGVNWNVMSTPIQASAAQISAFSAIMGNNNRPIQALEGRAIAGQQPGGEHVASKSQDHGGAKWEYEGGPGQRFWGELSADFTACVDGSAQSPINISSTILTPLKDLQFNYRPAMLNIINNGHTLQGNYGQRDQSDGGSMTVDGTEYRLLQFHFHWPSEHTVNGKQYLMEMHLVHQNAEGGLAVVGVLLDRGDYNRALEPFWANLPATAGASRDPNFLFDIDSVLPDDRRTYRYPGSLTTPPCSQGVKWLLIKTPVQMAPSQAGLFQSIIGYNARYTQPLHGREVLEDANRD